MHSKGNSKLSDHPCVMINIIESIFMLISSVVFCLYTELSSNWSNDHTIDFSLEDVYYLSLLEIYRLYLDFTRILNEQFDHG